MGARDKISQAFLEAFAAEWEARGAECLRVMAIEHPSDFVKIAASLLPKEFEITQTQLMEIPDDELDVFIEFARQRLAERALGASIGKAETFN